MKFLLDMAIPPGMAGWLRERGHNTVHAAEIGLARDQDLLGRAVTEKRVVITADTDFPHLLALSRATTPGVVLFRGGTYTSPEMVDLLERVFVARSLPSSMRAFTPPSSAISRMARKSRTASAFADAFLGQVAAQERVWHPPQEDLRLILHGHPSFPREQYRAIAPRSQYRLAEGVPARRRAAQLTGEPFPEPFLCAPGNKCVCALRPGREGHEIRAPECVASARHPRPPGAGPARRSSANAPSRC
jgi:predicted nuclease of predicted toxin-antitoxin system